MNLFQDIQNLNFASKYGFEQQGSGGDERYLIYWSPGKKYLIRVDTLRSLVSITKNVDPDTLVGTDEQLHQRFDLKDESSTRALINTIL